jgi:hypothetical protein
MARTSALTRLISREPFRIVDLHRAWHVGRRFDLVQSLEVAEHLPADSAEVLYDVPILIAAGTASGQYATTAPSVGGDSPFPG